MADQPRAETTRAVVETWAAATEDSTPLGPAADAHARMRRLWEAELAAYQDLT